MNEWNAVCQLNEILPATGVCALIDDKQIAIFRPNHDEKVYAISNIDPFAEASVLSRGIIGEHQGELWVASPLKKQHFRLSDGSCLEDPDYSIPSYEARVQNGVVEIKI